MPYSCMGYLWVCSRPVCPIQYYTNSAITRVGAASLACSLARCPTLLSALKNSDMCTERIENPCRRTSFETGSVVRKKTPYAYGVRRVR